MLYIAYVRPIIEHASTVWNPSGIGLNREVERVQRRLTKRLRDYCDLSYEERLASTRLIILQERRRRADLAMAFKSLHGAIAVDSRSNGVELSGAPTRSYRTNLLVHRAINNSVKNLFKYRIGSKNSRKPEIL